MLVKIKVIENKTIRAKNELKTGICLSKIRPIKETLEVCRNRSEQAKRATFMPSISATIVTYNEAADIARVSLEKAQRADDEGRTL